MSNRNTEGLFCQTPVIGSLFLSPFKKIPIIVSRWNDDNVKGWRAEIAETK